MKTLGSAYVNLLKTSIGSGVLNFPMLCKTYGLGLTTLLTIITGFFAATGLVLLVICSKEIGRTADLSNLATASVPYSKQFVNIAVFVKCFGVSISYLIITINILPTFLELFTDNKTIINPSFCLFVFVLFIAPFCYLKKMDKLKYTSFLGVLAIVFVIIASGWRYHNTINIKEPKISYIITNPNRKWLGGLGKFVFSFTCHQNIFAIYSELDNNSLKRMKKLIIAVSLSSLSLYISFGTYNYLLYGEKTKDNVLTNYPQDKLSILVKFLYIIVMGVSYPLQLSPGKTYFLNLFNITPDTANYDLITHILITCMIISSYLIAISGVGLGILYSIIGATASTFMCLILPPLYYFNMEVERTIILTSIAYISFLFGILVFVTTMVSISLGL